jgi:hypothetical protein
MITEGIGQHAPAKKLERIQHHAVRQCFEEARKRASHRDYQNGNSAWKRGIKEGSREIGGYGTLQQHEMPIFVGLLGEYAAWSYLVSRLPGVVGIDTKLNDGGDYGVDLKAFGLTMQVKTRQRDSGENLIKDNRFATAARACLFAEWTGEPVSSVYLLGWMWTEKVVARPTVPGVRNWQNFCVEDGELLPMNRLADDLEARRLVQQWH